jgi:hypothetical protein
VAKKKKPLLLPQRPWLHLHPLLLLPLPHLLTQLQHLPLLHRPPPPQRQHLHLSKSQKKRSSNRFLPCGTKRPLLSGLFVA